jgi:hypothetical protein
MKYIEETTHDYVPIWEKKKFKTILPKDSIETTIFTFIHNNHINSFIEYLNDIKKRNPYITFNLLEHHSLEVKNVKTGKRLLIVYNGLIWILNCSIYKIYNIPYSHHLELNIKNTIIYINKFIYN